MQVIRPEDLDFAALLRPGDRLVVGQATAEPLTLTARLMAAAVPDGCCAFLGPVYSDSFAGAVPAGLRFAGYGAIGKAATLTRRGLLDVVPAHYSTLPALFAHRRLGADVVLIAARRGPDGRLMTGLAVDYGLAAARHARLVIAEVSDAVPATPGSAWPADLPVHIAVVADRPPLEYHAPAPGAVEQQIAARVAALIPDGGVLQFGVGALPQAVAAALGGHRDLGVHSGIIVDGMVDLIEQGVITNAAKEIDPGITIGGLLVGSRRLYDFATANPALRLEGPEYTHGFTTISRLSRFCAVNSAVEVDLTGQVNAETAGGRYVGGIGGQVDFTRGANAVAGGRAIIALPATAAGGRISRIVPQVATVTTPRADVDVIVTEHGVAELRGTTLAQRIRRLIAIAAPEFRDGLDRAGHALLRGDDP